MALILKRITNPYECVRCSVTRKLISYGEEYYYDPNDNFIVDFNYYYDRKLAMKREEAQHKVNQAMGMFDYKQQLIAEERAFLEKTLFDREIYDPIKHGPLKEFLDKEMGKDLSCNKGGDK